MLWTLGSRNIREACVWLASGAVFWVCVYSLEDEMIELGDIWVIHDINCIISCCFGILVKDLQLWVIMKNS